MHLNHIHIISASILVLIYLSVACVPMDQKNSRSYEKKPTDIKKYIINLHFYIVLLIFSLSISILDKDRL